MLPYGDTRAAAEEGSAKPKLCCRAAGSAALELQGSGEDEGGAATGAGVAAAVQQGTATLNPATGQLDQEQLSIVLHCTLW